MKKFTYLVLATTLAFSGAIALVVEANPVLHTKKQVQHQKAATLAQRILYVDAKRGTDSASAGSSEASPFRTITAALQKAEAGTAIQLAPGRYSAGETFPIQLKPGVILKGEETQQGQSVVITGGGDYISRIWARQNITILAGQNTQILGVTVTNPNTRGTGIWVESTNPTIRNSTFVNNNREGVFVSGTGQPIIENNQFMYNGGNGISVTKQSKGEIRRNVFQDTGFALSIGHDAAPLVADNQIRQNRIGVVVTQAARPILERNIIENNTDYGIAVIADAQPQVASNNSFRGNERQDQLIARGPQGVPPTPDQSQAMQPTGFSCQPYGNSFATIAQKGIASIPQPMIIWNSTEFDAPENRCSDVTQRLNQLVTESGGQLDKMVFSTGRVNNDKVVCLVQDLQETCQSNNMLFPLSGANASNPTEVLKRLIVFSVDGKGNPVQELGEEAIAPLASVAKNLEPELGLWFVAH